MGQDLPYFENIGIGAGQDRVLRNTLRPFARSVACMPRLAVNRYQMAGKGRDRNKMKFGILRAWSDGNWQWMASCRCGTLA
jgi:hypothetical protein